MLFSYNWLQSFFDKKLPDPKELARLIVGHSFEVESMEKSGKDTILDIAILSNRPDCFSHIGIAREIAAILGYKLVLPKTKAVKSKTAVAAKSLVDVAVMDAVACPRYSAKVVTGVKVGPSPKWVQERLVACGLRAINNIVDATNYVMLETGQPLHAFDWDKLDPGKTKAKKIIVRMAQDGESIDSLGDKKYELKPSMLLIADGSGPLAVAGIKGGKRAEISQDTTTVVLEAANFNSRSVRITSRNLGLATDASLRFAHGLDRGQILGVAERLADLVVQTAGGQVAVGAVDRNPNPAKPKKMALNMDKAECLLGAAIQTARAKKILESLGFSVRRGNKADLDVVVPTWRTDVGIAEDLIEEIGRIDGYDKVEASAASAVVLAPVKNYFYLWKTTIRDAMIAAGWSETRNYTFVSGKDCQDFGFSIPDLLEIKNPVNADFSIMRPSLLINLAKNPAKNPGREILCQFEIGKVFGVNRRDEPTMFAGIALGQTFFEVKGALEFVLKRLGIAGFSFEPAKDGGAIVGGHLYDPGRTARLVSGKNRIGMVGWMSENIAAAIGMKPLVIFELNVDVMAKMATRANDYRPISTHPLAIRDISVDVPLDTLSAGVSDVVAAADDSKLIKSFEIPADPYVYPDKKTKNILFKFYLQSDSKTLDSKEIGDWQLKTIEAIEKNQLWRVKTDSVKKNNQ